ncbi:DUF3833 domain-containing protein [Minwuia sp.]|uniref:DUF3833 domain-containing protein n=1 Tax=Minwuia sp. TaxID=2493630 RepID=UPI003A8D11A4
MTRWIRKAGVAAAFLFLLTACGSPNLEDYREKTPALDLVAYFEGTTDAWGLFQDRFGKVRRQFHVVIEGRVEGDVLILDEDFVYDDGETENRVWRIRQTGPDSWEGEAEGVVGVATGERAGNALNWRYDFDLPFDGDTLRVHFDDWLWQQNDRVMINRAYVSKFGIHLGEVIITFVKRDPA